MFTRRKQANMNVAMDVPECHNIVLQTILTMNDSVDCRLRIVYMICTLSRIIRSSQSYTFSAVNYCWSMSHMHVRNTVISARC